MKLKQGKRTSRTSVYLSQEELSKLEEAAKKIGMTVSGYIRRLIKRNIA